MAKSGNEEIIKAIVQELEEQGNERLIYETVETLWKEGVNETADAFREKMSDQWFAMRTDKNKAITAFYELFSEEEEIPDEARFNGQTFFEMCEGWFLHACEQVEDIIKVGFDEEEEMAKPYVLENGENHDVIQAIVQKLEEEEGLLSAYINLTWEEGDNKAADAFRDNQSDNHDIIQQIVKSMEKDEGEIKDIINECWSSGENEAVDAFRAKLATK